MAVDPLVVKNPSAENPNGEMQIVAPSRPKYDPATAVTFLIAGVGLGSVLTLLFASRFDRNFVLPAGANPQPAH